MGEDQPGHRERAMNDLIRAMTGTRTRARAAPESSITSTSIPRTKRSLTPTNWSSTWGRSIPSTHGVLRVILKLDGENVLGTECVIGYLHRGVEKIAENRTYAMFNPYVDRMDYVAAVSNGLGYCESGGEAAQRGGAAAGAIHPRHPHGALPHRQPPGLAGHARARHRRADAAVLLLPRSRRDPGDLRKILRRAPDDARVPHRRLHLRSLRRLREGMPRNSATTSCPSSTSTKSC